MQSQRRYVRRAVGSPRPVRLDVTGEHRPRTGIRLIRMNHQTWGAAGEIERRHPDISTDVDHCFLNGFLQISPVAPFREDLEQQHDGLVAGLVMNGKTSAKFEWRNGGAYAIGAPNGPPVFQPTNELREDISGVEFRIPRKHLRSSAKGNDVAWATCYCRATGGSERQGPHWTA